MPLPPYRAQLATLAEDAPSGEQWLHELKYDGYRIGCLIESDDIQLQSRRERDWTASFPEVVEGARALGVQSAILDGEVAVVLPNGTTSFQALQNVFSGASRDGLTYFVFDLLYLNGRSLADQPLQQRKAECEKLLAALPEGSRLRYSRHFETDGPALLKQACALGAEGIVSKRRDQAYRPGRSEGWLKSKCLKRQELVVGGFTDPEGARGGIGALLVGYYEGKALRFGGKVGTGRGFTATFLSKTRKALEALETSQCPFEPPPPGWLGRNAHWVEPTTVIEVAFAEWTEGGHVRHASFQGFRDDKLASEVVREQAAPVRAPVATAARSPRASVKTEAHAPVVRGVSITTPERAVYPALGFDKLKLATLYAELAEHLLPHIAGRPLTLVRCDKGVRAPDALRAECKFLRHEAGYHRWASEHIRRVHIQEQKKVGEYLVVDTPEGVVSLIQGDIIELHAWNSTALHLETPDRVVFDLDPGAGVEWARVLAAARRLREHLAARSLESWVKLTGGKGLHVVVPFAPEHEWPDVYAFTREVALGMTREDPGTFTIDFAKSARAEKILIDYKRNYRGAIAVAAFSTRASPDGTLSVPIAWRELKASLSPRQFTVQNILARLRRQKTDPWAGFWTAKQRLSLK
ncbi:MAG: DNA ligase D [Myxococcales bacterium]|nr:MAG: DNA ligase D [Myxococcales bacterium]